MADDDRHDRAEAATSLELPSLRSALRRRKRKQRLEPPPEAEVFSKPGPEPVAQDTSILPVAMAEAPPEDVEPEAPTRRRPRRAMRVRLPGPLVALLTGAIVGLALVGLTSASLHLCSSMRGTSSCGSPGFVLLLAIALVAILLGSLLLRLFGVDAHGSTSFLGVGLLLVLILLALLPVLDDRWAVVAVPVLAMVTFLVAWWLTATYVEPGERAR
jgi:hypothetical protein